MKSRAKVQQNMIQSSSHMGQLSVEKSDTDENWTKITPSMATFTIYPFQVIYELTAVF